MARYFKQREGFAQGIGDVYTEEELQGMFDKESFIIFNERDYEKWKEDWLDSGELIQIDDNERER